MFDVKELFSRVNRLKRESLLRDGNVVTNQVLTGPALTEFSAQKDSVLAANESAIALVCNDNGVTRLYFYLTSLEETPALQALLHGVSARPIVTECVGKAQFVDSAADALCRAGFELYTRMHRWYGKHIHFTEEKRLNSKMFQAASAQDVDRVSRLLCDTFDPLVSHLPSREKLLALIEQRLVYYAKREDELLAVVCFERIGMNGLYLYQTAVAEKYRASGLGVLLLQHALYQYRDCSCYTSWTEDNNTAANRLPQMIGLSHNGQENAVLIYR